MRQFVFNTVLAVLCIGSVAFAQPNSPERDRANDFIAKAQLLFGEGGNRYKVMEYYQLAADLLPQDAVLNVEAGKWMLELGKSRDALVYLERAYAVSPTAVSGMTVLVGRVYHLNGEFQKAITWYGKFYQEWGHQLDVLNDRRIKSIGEHLEQYIIECRRAEFLQTKVIPYTLTRLEGGVNSEFPDYGPIINGAGTALYFTSRRVDADHEHVNDVPHDVDGLPFEDIYVARHTVNGWALDTEVTTKLNRYGHNSALAISPEGDQLFVYNEENGGDIYVSNMNENKGIWARPKSYRWNTSAKEGSISFSAAGDMVVFSRRRMSGDMDLYYALRRPNGEWTPERVFGNDINTNKDEISPFLSADGQTLYFSSDGWETVGGFDIFRSTYDPETRAWSRPQNLGFPLNTAQDDIHFSLTVDGRRAYIACNRADGLGHEDIYEVTLPTDGPNFNQITLPNFLELLEKGEE